MIFTIRHGESGWGEYVLNGTKMHPRDKSKIFTGSDIDKGDEICEGGYYSVVLGFKGKISNKKVYQVMKAWEKKFMHGFNNEEYYMDYVIHQDTDDTHVHVRISDMNLFTGTKLKFYYHKTDLKRKDTIQRYLDAKFDLESPLDNKILLKENYYEFLDDWCKANGDSEIDHKRKKNRDAFRVKNHNKMVELVSENRITKFESIEKFYESVNYKVVNQGYDQTKDTYYMTLQTPKGYKAKVYGEFYNPVFWTQTREKRKEQMKTNHTDCTTEQKTKKELYEEVVKLNKKRKEFLDKRYGSARKRALKQLQEEAMEIKFGEEEREDWVAFQNELNRDERIKKQARESEEKQSKKKEKIMDISDVIVIKEPEIEKIREIESGNNLIVNPIMVSDIIKTGINMGR